jgi:hypothetical protein
MEFFQKKYLKYKTKYELIKNQTGGNYLLTLTENDKCPICLERLIDTCSTCNENGKNFCPNPKTCGGTNPQHCIIYIGNCGHLIHSHCFNKIPYVEPRHKQLCPLCRVVFNPIATPSPQYAWSSGFIEPSTHSLIKIRENESGGKWKQIILINLIELIKTRQPIAPYIYNHISRSDVYSSPEKYNGIVKTYEDTIKQ